jgi:hypothetical protein
MSVTLVLSYIGVLISLLGPGTDGVIDEVIDEVPAVEVALLTVTVTVVT